MQRPARSGRALPHSRHLATGKGKPLGSLFFNPGGPGGPGAEALTVYYSLFPARVRARYEIVSFDPQGIGNSTAVRCFRRPRSPSMTRTRT